MKKVVALTFAAIVLAGQAPAQATRVYSSNLVRTECQARAFVCESPTVDASLLAELERRLTETHAVAFFDKLSLSARVDELTVRFAQHHRHGGMYTRQSSWQI
jgi:hypothetical protein